MVDPHPCLTDAGQCLAPYVPRDPLLAIPWLAHFAWCLREGQVVAAFRAETGCPWTPGATPLERLIDEATGAQQAFMVQFAAWVNANLWGPVHEKD